MIINYEFQIRNSNSNLNDYELYIILFDDGRESHYISHLLLYEIISRDNN